MIPNCTPIPGNRGGSLPSGAPELCLLREPVTLSAERALTPHSLTPIPSVWNPLTARTAALRADDTKRVEQQGLGRSEVNQLMKVIDPLGTSLAVTAPRSPLYHLPSLSLLLF